jgi:hypothetical protein
MRVPVKSVTTPGRILALALIAAAAAFVAAKVASTGKAAAAPPQACTPVWHRVASVNVGTDAVLAGVAAIADDDVWSVGYSHDVSYQTLVEHWDGTGWSVVPSPNVGTGDNALLGISAVGPNNIWAVGTAIVNHVHRTLTEHWDGSGWSVVPSPNVGTSDNRLFAVAAISSTDVWAVGDYDNGRNQTLTEHWSGTSWSAVPSPNPGTGGNLLYGVGGSRSNDVWAVGTATTGPAGSAVTEHWNGTAWSAVPSANGGDMDNPLDAVAAIAPDDVWAVGDFVNGVEKARTLGEHWDGSSWTVVATPARVQLTGVAARGSGDVWAVGFQDAGFADITLSEHWDGRRWSVLPTVDVTTKGNVLMAVSATPTGQIWAVGDDLQTTGGYETLTERLCEHLVTDTGFQPSAPLVRQGYTPIWSIDPADTSAHSVTDTSGLDLFDSGARAPGSSFAYRFAVAGTFPIVDTVTGNQGSVRVPIKLSPASGSETTSFTVTWSPDALPSGTVADVQVERPGSTTFSNWMTNTSARNARFTPDAGPGTYDFRSRLGNTAGTAATDWSPVRSITVN